MKKIFLLSNTSFYGFILIVAFFHLWYFLEMMQVLPRISFKILSSLIFFYIFILYFVKDLKQNLNIVTIIIGIFIFYLILYNLIYHYNYTILDRQTSTKIMYDNFRYIYAYIIYFFIGFYYKGYSSHSKIIYILYAILTFNALMFVDLNTYALDTSIANLDLFGIYLFLGDTYAIFSILTIIITPSKKLQLLLFFISLPILYILMSRTSLYVFVLTFIIYIFIVNKRLFFISTILLVGISIIIFISNTELINQIINSRMLGFLFGKVDPSVNAREEYITIGLSGIMDHWYIGDFAGEVYYYGTTGKYIHSYLGLLRQYGIIAFILFGVLVLFLLKEILLWVLQTKRHTVDYDVFIGLAIFMLMEIITSRAIYFPYVFFALGIVAGLYKDRSWTFKTSNVVCALTK